MNNCIPLRRGANCHGEAGRGNAEEGEEEEKNFKDSHNSSLQPRPSMFTEWNCSFQPRPLSLCLSVCMNGCMGCIEKNL